MDRFDVSGVINHQIQRQTPTIKNVCNTPSKHSIEAIHCLTRRRPQTHEITLQNAFSVVPVLLRKIIIQQSSLLNNGPAYRRIFWRFHIERSHASHLRHALGRRSPPSPVSRNNLHSLSNTYEDIAPTVRRIHRSKMFALIEKISFSIFLISLRSPISIDYYDDICCGHRGISLGLQYLVKAA